MPATKQKRTHNSVYVFRDVRGVVLYVGISVRIGERMAHHRNTKARAWWRKIHTIELHHVDSREESEALERELIARLNPIHNNYLRPDEEQLEQYRRKARRQLFAQNQKDYAKALDAARKEERRAISREYEDRLLAAEQQAFKFRIALERIYRDPEQAHGLAENYLRDSGAL